MRWSRSIGADSGVAPPLRASARSRANGDGRVETARGELAAQRRHFARDANRATRSGRRARDRRRARRRSRAAECRRRRRGRRAARWRLAFPAPAPGTGCRPSRDRRRDSRQRLTRRRRGAHAGDPRHARRPRPGVLQHAHVLRAVHAARRHRELEVGLAAGRVDGAGGERQAVRRRTKEARAIEHRRAPRRQAFLRREASRVADAVNTSCAATPASWCWP